MRKNQENGKKMSKNCSFAHCEKNRDPPLKAQGVNLVRACESLLRAYEVLCCGSAQYIEYTQFTPKTLAFAFPESVRPVVGSICRNGQVLVFGQFPHTVYTVYTGDCSGAYIFLAQPPRKKAGYFSTPRKCRYWKDWDPLNPNPCSGPGFKLILKSNIAKAAFPMQFVRGEIWEFWPGDRSPTYGYTWWGVWGAKPPGAFFLESRTRKTENLG